MKKWLVVVAMLGIMGCKGEQGPQGPQGASGLNSIVNRSGAITSDDMFVSVSGLNISRGDILSVYHCLNTTCVQAPIFQPGTGINAFYAVNGATVELINLQSAGSNLYFISALEKI